MDLDRHQVSVKHRKNKDTKTLMEVRRRENGGDGEIRTLERLPFTHFPGVLLQPLGHVTLNLK